MNGRLEHQIKTEARMNSIVIDQPIFIKEWYAYMNGNGEADYKTVEIYLRYILNYLKYNKIKNINVLNVKTSDVASYMSQLRTTTRNNQVVATSNSYKATVWFALNSFFKFLKVNHYIEENPMENIPRASATKDLDTINRVSLNPEELQEVINTVMTGVGNKGARSKQKAWRSRDLAIILLLIYTGIRVTALTEINMKDVDLDARTIKVTDKRDKTFLCVIPEEVIPYLEDWQHKRYELLDYNFLAEPFFISNQRTRITSRSVARLVDKYTSTLDKHVSPHKFRASYATNLYEQTKDIYFVQQCMGHSNIETTKRYINSGHNAKAEASRMMSGMLRI